MPMVSYAQNGEDVVLRRLFPQSNGFYIDVGANDPEYGTPTRHFYEKGWRGINVEPGAIVEKVCRFRPNDINLNVGLSDRSGEYAFYEFENFSGWSTCDAALAQQHAADYGAQFTKRSIKMHTLAEICENYVRQPIDFISIDVEGHEKQVIEGGDWRRWRPVAVVVEATHPNSTIATHHRWEPILLAADYLFALFDGLNRFYIRAEDRHLLPRLEAPANVLDHFISYQEDSQQKEIEHLRRHVRSLETRSVAADGVGPLSLKFAQRLHRMSARFPRLSWAVRRTLQLSRMA